jgi:hypothetical protein
MVNDDLMLYEEIGQRRQHMRNTVLGLVMATALMIGASASGGATDPQTKREKLTNYENARMMVEKNLVTFDTLDFVVFSGQQWLRLHESHSKDVVVNWPDGHHTNGIDKHIEDLKAMFVYAPDTKIKVHPIKFGSGEYTCVIGEMTGTFTQPMPAGDGKFIQPTGKSFSLTMCTVGRWKDGVMVEEWLFWDNASYMKQIGLGQ